MAHVRSDLWTPRYWIFWFRAGSTRMRQRSSFASPKRLAIFPSSGCHRQTEGLRCREGRSAAGCQSTAKKSVRTTGPRIRVNQPDCGEMIQVNGTHSCFLSAFGIITVHFRVGKTSPARERLPSGNKSRLAEWEDAIASR